MPLLKFDWSIRKKFLESDGPKSGHWSKVYLVILWDFFYEGCVCYLDYTSCYEGGPDTIPASLVVGLLQQLHGQQGEGVMPREGEGTVCHADVSIPKIFDIKQEISGCDSCQVLKIKMLVYRKRQKISKIIFLIFDIVWCPSNFPAYLSPIKVFFGDMLDNELDIKAGAELCQALAPA